MKTSGGKKRRKKRQPSAPAASAAAAPLLDRFLDAGLMLVVGLVPLVFYPRAFNALLVKDLTLGILVSFMGASVLIFAFSGRRVSWPRSPLNAAIWAMLLVTLVAFSLSSYRYAGVGAFLRLAAGALLYFLLATHIRQISQAKRLLGAAAAGALLACLYGALQRLGMDFVPWSKELTRIPGPYGNATYFASYLILLLPVMITMAVFPPVEGQYRTLARASFAVVSAMMFACLVWTKTVAAIGGLGIALGVGAVLIAHVNAAHRQKQVSPKAALIAALVIIAGWALAFGLAPAQFRSRVLSLAHPTDMADVRRVLIWKSALQIFSEKPVLGGGPGTYQIYSRGRYAPVVADGKVQEASGALHAHNAFLEILAEKGGLGVLAFLWLVAAYFWAAAKAVKRAADPFWRNLVIALAAGVLAYLIQNLFAVTFFIVGCQVFFWLALALTVVAGQQVASPSPTRSISLRLGGAARPVAASVLVAAVLALWGTASQAVLAEYHYWRGETSGESGMFREATEQFQQAVSLNPYCQRAWYQLGASLGIQGQWRDAVGPLERSAALSPDYMRTQYNLGAAYFSLKHYARAERAFRRALQAERSALNYQALSDAYARQGKLDMAVEQVRRGTRDYPDDIPLRQYAARLFLQKGDRAQAQYQIEYAARLDPQNPETLRLQDLLRLPTGDK